MTDQIQKETFEDFKKSFFYGKRSDLSFKFLSDLSDEDGSAFLQDLFQDVVTAIDTQDLAILKQRLVQGQVQGYHHQKNFDYDKGPFTPLAKPLTDLRLTLLTSSGHFLEGQDPNPLGRENMTQEEAESRIFDFLKEEPVLSEIPFDSDPKQIKVRHGGYDVKAALRDPNVSFPYGAMKNLKAQGRFSDLTAKAYSFLGACSQKRLMKKTLPGWITLLKEAGTEAAVLVPV